LISNKHGHKIVDVMRRVAKSNLLSRCAGAPDVPHQHEDATRIADDLQHVLYMCDQMDDFLMAGRRDKFNRWLGWAQKTLQIHRCVTKEEMKILNRPERKEPKPLGVPRLDYSYQKLGQGYVLHITSSPLVQPEPQTEDVKLEIRVAVEQALLDLLNRIANEE